MAFGWGLLLKPHGDGPITDEPESWSSNWEVSVPHYLSPSPLVLPPPTNIQDSEPSNVSGSSDSSSSYYFRPFIAEPSRIAAQSTSAHHMARPDNAKLFPVSPTGDSSTPASSANLLPTLSVTGPPNTPPPPYTPKQGALAPLTRSISLPDFPIPGVVDLTQQIKTLSQRAFAHDGFADIHWGEWERRLENGKIEPVSISVRHLGPALIAHPTGPCCH